MSKHQAESTTPDTSLKAWTAEDFLKRDLPAKEALIDGLLYRRDLIALAGRRRHGKTNFILNLAVGLSLNLPEFLGYSISKEFRVLAFFLEDDTREIQDKLRRILGDGDTHGRLSLMTREGFYEAGVQIDLEDSRFRDCVLRACTIHQPDLIVFDNLAQLIGADYSNPKRIHTLTVFAYELTSRFNAGVLVAAHPRKRSKDEYVTLRDDAEGFFENVMGSSHFVNSFGSLWGLERDLKTDRTVFLGGAQRLTGQQSITTLEMREDGRLQLVSDFDENLALALNTPARQKAWSLLPSQPFTYMEAVAAVKPAMRSQSTFNSWWHGYLLRLGLVVRDGDRYRKANTSGTREEIFDVADVG